MRKVLYLLIFLGSLSFAYGQQDPQLTMTMFNKQLLNQSYVGAPGALQITGAGRTQWVGIDGHPNTFTLSLNGPVRILRGGLGLSIHNDQIGPFGTTGIRGAYAFRIPIGGAALQIGISPGVYFRQFDPTNLLPGQKEDALLSAVGGPSMNYTHFDIGGGLYFHIPSKHARNDIEKFYAGLSIDHILEPKINKLLPSSAPPNGWNSNIDRHIVFHAGYRFGNGAICFVPNLFYKMAMNSNLMQIDLVGNLHIKPLVIGLGYRGLTNTSEAIGLLGFHANQRLFVAYSYDYNISGLRSSTSGSHELLVQYTFPKITRFYPPDLDVKQNPAIR